MHTEMVKYHSISTQLPLSNQFSSSCMLYYRESSCTRFARTSRGPLGLNIRWYSINKFEIVLITAVIVTSMENPYIYFFGNITRISQNNHETVCTGFIKFALQRKSFFHIEDWMRRRTNIHRSGLGLFSKWYKPTAPQRNNTNPPTWHG